jgi:hypothetical protein
MKIMDVLGNELKAGDVVFFQPIRGLVTIREIEEPGKIDETQPGRVVLDVRIPFRLDGGKKDVVMGDMMHVHYPEEGKSAEEQVNDILKGKGKSPVRVLNRKVGGIDG